MKKENEKRNIETFIEKFEKFSAKATIRQYRANLKDFFKTIGKNPNTYIVDIKKLDGEERENTIKTYEKDVEKYWLALKDKNKAPKTLASNISSVRTFLSEFNIELSTKFWKNIRRRSPPSIAITDDIIPTNEQMRKILQHADLKAKALFLVLDSSGLRVAAALQLEPEDIDLKKDPVRINIRAETTMTKQRRTTFISNEARDALIEWLKVRDKYLETAVKRSRVVPSHEIQEYGKMKMVPVKKSLDDSRVFPFSHSAAREMWNRLLEKAGLAERDKRTNFRKMHLYCLRKRFRVNMPKNMGGDGIDITEALMGHAGYLTGSSRRLSEEDLAEGYKKGVNGLLIFEKGEDIQKMRDLQKKNETKETVINRLAEKIEQLSSEKEQRVQEVEETVRKVMQEERKKVGLSPEKVMQKKIVRIDQEIIDMQKKIVRIDQEIADIRIVLKKNSSR